jgi:hypothetical protein
MKIWAISLAAALGLGASTPASAAVTWFASRSDFLAAAPGASDPTGMSGVSSQAQADAAMEASPTAWHNAAGERSFDLAFGDFTVSLASAGRGGDQFFTTTLGGGAPVSDVGFSGAAYVIGNPQDEAHDYTFGGAGYSAFGFNLYEPRSGTECGSVPCIISGFTFTAFGSDGVTLGAYTKNFATPAEFAFVGLTSTDAITKVSVREAYLGGGVNTCCGYDNEYFGNYLASSLNAAPAGGVPESQVWALMIIGFGAAGSVLRGRRKLQPA